MKKDKETKKRRFKAGNGSLAFYIMAVIFLLLGICNFRQRFAQIGFLHQVKS